MQKHIKNDDVPGKSGLNIKRKIIPSVIVVCGLALLLFFEAVRPHIVISSFLGIIAYETVELFTFSHKYRKQEQLLGEQAQNILDELWHEKIGKLLILCIMFGVVLLFSVGLSIL